MFLYFITAFFLTIDSRLNLKFNKQKLNEGCIYQAYQYNKLISPKLQPVLPAKMLSYDSLETEKEETFPRLN